MVLQSPLVTLGHLFAFRKASVSQQVLNSRAFRFQHVVPAFSEKKHLGVSYAQGAGQCELVCVASSMMGTDQSDARTKVTG